MASITKRGDSWFAQVRRKDHRSISRPFPKKTQAIEWARNIEADIDAKKFQDTRSASDWLFSELIDRYNLGVGEVKKFKRNKVNVLKKLRTDLGHLNLNELDESTIMEYANRRRKAGAGGVTISIDLTYIATYFAQQNSCEKYLFYLTPYSLPEKTEYFGVKLKSAERDR